MIGDIPHNATRIVLSQFVGGEIWQSRIRLSASCAGFSALELQTHVSFSSNVDS
jgi:hypothetical protein